MKKMNTVAKWMALWLLTGFKFLWIGLLFVLSLPVLIPTYLITYLIYDMPEDIEGLIDKLKESLDNDETNNGGF